MNPLFRLLAVLVALLAMVTPRDALAQGADPAAWEITVFTDDPALGAKVLAALRTQGFSNPANMVQEEPNPTLNIKTPVTFGHEAVMEVVAGIVEPVIGGHKLERKPGVLETEEPWLFINLPSAMLGRSVAPPPASSGKKSAVKVVVFSDDPAMGEAVLSKLRGIGFTNPENYVGENPNADPNIKCSDAPAMAPLLYEAKAAVEGMVTAPLKEMVGEIPLDDYLFINLPSARVRLKGGVTGVSGGSFSRSAFQVTVFSDDDATGRAVLRAMEAAGFTNPGNMVLDSPNSAPNVKTGSHPDAAAALQAAQQVVGGLFPRATFEPKPGILDTPDWLFINVPVAVTGRLSDSAPVSGFNPADFEVTVFADDQSTGEAILKALESKGFTNPGNMVLDSPNDDANIKTGSKAGADQALKLAGDALRGLFPKVTFTPKPGILDTDNWLFINAPSAVVGKPGGSSISAGKFYGDPKLKKGVPQACGMSDDALTYGLIRLGSRVKLGVHRPVNGDKNWDATMKAYKGQITPISELAGTDLQGCPIVRVQVDGGAFVWRVRDLKLID
jgi:hypothetical protein